MIQVSEDGIRRYQPDVQEAAMQKTIAMIFALRALFGPAVPAIEAPNPPTPQPEVVRVANAYVNAMLASDAAMVAALYQEDGVAMPNCRPLVKGRPAIEQYFRGLMKGGKITTFVLTHTESSISGDTAYDVGTYTQRLSTRDGMVDDTGKYIVMLKRTGGDWKIAYTIHNSDRPSTIPPETGASR
jgi:ketosteroid isomerase-like protein